MIWGYFDESGEHAPGDGRLVRMTIGGALTTPEKWNNLSIAWADLLETVGISEFHMKDFEAYRGQFKTWTEDKHKNFLRNALNCIATYTQSFMGATTSAWRKENEVNDTYEHSVADIILHLANESAFGHQNAVSVVFARHPEFKFSKVEKYFEIANFNEARLGTCAVSTPRSSCPLQVADLIAYEIRCMKGQNESSTGRYPVRYLRELGCVFRLSGF